MSGTVSQTAPRSDERAGQERESARTPAAHLVASGLVTGISAAAVARSRTLGEARWSPGGDPPGLARRLRRPGRPRGGARRRLAAPTVTVTAEVPVTGLGAYGGGGYCWVDDDTLVYAAADGRLLVDRRRPAVGCACCRATGAPPRRPRRPTATGSRSCSSATTRATSPSSTSTAARGRGGCRTPTTRGIPRGRPTAARWPGTSGTSRTCRGTGRASWPSRSTMPTRTRRCVAGGDDVAVGQPRFSPDGDTLAFVAEPTAG